MRKIQDADLKAPTGIAGLDTLAGGGLPRELVTLISGGAGTGKTVFALQSLAHGARQSEPGIFVSCEEDPNRLRRQLNAFGWEADEPDLTILDARISASVVDGGEFDLLGLLAGLERLIERTGARRLAIDGIDQLLDALPGRQEVRREAHRLHEWLKAQGVTVMLTGKADREISGFRDFDSLLEFLADCVIRLDQQSDGTRFTRTLRIMKLRGWAHASYECPFVIAEDGIQVADLLTGGYDIDYEVSSERLPTGVAGLDAMLGGGFYRGSSIIISGSPGTAKTTLAASFADACCQRGEPVLLVSFDESSPQIIRNLRSVGIDLAPHVNAGLLEIHAFRSRGTNPQQHVLDIQRLWRGFDARHVIVDPVSALEMDMDDLGASMAQLLIDLARQQGRTILTTSLTPPGGDTEKTELGLSTGADTWLVLTNQPMGGERNRSLTIVKSRGMKHSNQVRELILDSTGLRLADVYVAGGEVLMGTLRWEREAQEREARAAERARLEEELFQARARAGETQAHLESLQKRLEIESQRIERLESSAASERERHRSRREEIGRLRTTSGKQGDDSAGGEYEP